MKKGFTLIELLAVIIILSVIALIATPVVLNVVENSKKEAFKDSVYGAIDAAKYYYYENPNTVQLSVTDLKLQGKQFKSGIINLKEGMFEAVNVTDGEYCGNTVDSKVEVVKGNCGIETGSGSITVALKEIGINYLKVEVVNADFEDSFYSYEYKLTNSEGLTIQNWTESRENSYTFKDLKEDTEYIVQAKLKTEKLLKPTITPDTTNYAKNKVITIEYPVYENYSFEYYYSLDGENYTKVDNTKIDIEITNNTTIYARVKDGENNYDTTYEEVKIDNEAPVITDTPSDITITEGESYNLNDISVTDNSGIYNITKTINNTSTLKHGTYLVGYKVTDEAGNTTNITRNLKVKMPADTSGASTPNISSGMIPVVYDYGKEAFVKADTNSNWYNYNNKEWANIVILKDKNINYNAEEIIPESNVDGYFVWIPRYKYQIFNLGNYTSVISSKPSTSTEQEIKIIFESKSTSKSTGNAVGSYLTHPAFTLGTEELDGIWVAKYETSGSTADINVLPKVTSLRNINVKTMFALAYNYERTMDSHMMKNTEWGAVAYLSHSKYGINQEIRINNSATYTTGCAATTSALNYVGRLQSNHTEGYYNGCENAYNTSIGYLASTTGNISGIYDMSGGAWEYVSAYMQNTLGSSGFTSSTISNYNSKYFDVYPADSEIATYNKKILGDATGELGPFYYYKDSDNEQRYHSTWGTAYAYFVGASYPWFVRGGYYADGAIAGSFAFSRPTGAANSAASFRLVLK